MLSSDASLDSKSSVRPNQFIQFITQFALIDFGIEVDTVINFNRCSIPWNLVYVASLKMWYRQPRNVSPPVILILKKIILLAKLARNI